MKKHGGCASCERADGEKKKVSAEQGNFFFGIDIIGISIFGINIIGISIFRIDISGISIFGIVVWIRY